MKLGKSIRKDFPIYSRVLDPGNLVYLDSAATSLKPQRVLDAMMRYYTEYSVNVERGVYGLSEKATASYEQARNDIASFIGASRPEEIVFVRNATEAINLVARSFGARHVGEGEGILLTEMEHHANLVPWQELAKEKRARLFFLPFGEEGELEWNPKEFVAFLKTRRIKILSLTHVSNVLGTVNPVREIVAAAHAAGVFVIVDAAQSVPHLPIDVKALGVDFLVFSGHKMFGPTGIGVLWGTYELLEKMPPFLTGGEMIEDVRWETSSYREPPHRFEAGTPHIAGVIGLGEAVCYLRETGMENAQKHGQKLLQLGMSELAMTPGLKILGPSDVEKRSGVISFIIEGVHPHDIGSFLDEKGVMIRAGDHCARPLHRKLKIPASARVSFHIYNDEEDVGRAVEALREMVKIFTS